MATHKQLSLIHVAKSQLGLSDDDYRDCLRLVGADSAKGLNDVQVGTLLDVFKGLGFLQKSGDKHKRWEEYDDRYDERFATGRQLRMLEGMFMNSPEVRVKTALSFFHFVKRIAGVDYPGWLLKNDVQKVKKAIENIG